MTDSNITLNGSLDDLSSHISVGEADAKTVLRRVILILVLSSQLSAGAVIGLSLSSSSEFHLETLEVSLVLLYLDEWHIYLI